jgi:ribosomal protein L37AE/L43A
MSRFRVATKLLKETEGEKCPKCLNTWQNFMIVTEDLWACYDCGTVFVPKRIKVEESAGLKEQILKQHEEFKAKQKEETEEKAKAEEFKCPQCEFIGKNAMSLRTHVRLKHGNG